MLDHGVLRMARIVAMAGAIAAVGFSQVVWGQRLPGTILPNGRIPVLSSQATSSEVSTTLYQQSMSQPRRAPLARLIENPDQTDGAPPYALTDQSGAVHRYVEPVPGIDLSSYVGQVVAVRSDTGMTLLASQLELPQQALRPMVSGSERYSTAIDSTGA